VDEHLHLHLQTEPHLQLQSGVLTKKKRTTAAPTIKSPMKYSLGIDCQKSTLSATAVWCRAQAGDASK